MKKYVVESSKDVDVSRLHSREERIQAYKNALEDLRRTVADFAAQHPGKVKIGQGAWINTTLEIEADPKVVPALRKVPGIARVEEPRTINAELSQLIDISVRVPSLGKDVLVSVPRGSDLTDSFNEASAFVRTLEAHNKIADPEAGVNPPAATHAVVKERDGKYHLRRMGFN